MARSVSMEYGRPQVSLSGFVRLLWPARPSRRDLVDVRELPDHLKRDVGILDGSRPVGSVRW